MSAVLQIRKLRPQDLHIAMRLKEFPGWNQTRSDWEVFLELDPRGVFAGEVNGQVVATTSTVTYGNQLAWIGMVLVDPEFRRRGIATSMMEHAIHYLESRDCPCIKLDATEDGAKVYEKLGFQYEYQVERWHSEPGSGACLEIGMSASISTAESSDLEEVAELDLPAFGASRRDLLSWYLTLDSPRYKLKTTERTNGFLLTRPGSGAQQIGPIVANSDQEAQALLRQALTIEVSNILDLPCPNPGIRQIAQELGFSRRRILYRMYRGQTNISGDVSRIYGLAGFEFG